MSHFHTPMASHTCHIKLLIQGKKEFYSIFFGNLKEATGLEKSPSIDE